jgi:Domain of unknown function (DUF4124)
MSVKNPILIGIALAALSLHALAADDASRKRYRWKDPQGLVHYTDTLPAEALQVGYDVVDAQGLVIHHVDRARTAEEKKADAATAAAELETKQKAIDQSNADQQLLVAYGTEEDLATSQKAKLVALDQTVQNVRMSQTDQEKSLADELAHAASLERNNKPVPAPVTQQIEILRKNIEDQKAFIEHKQRERVETEQKSALEMAHYRQLRAAQAAKAAKN